MSATHEHVDRTDEFLERAFREALIARCIITQAEVDSWIDVMHERTPSLGGRVVARAWVDPAFRSRLLADGSAAVRELGIEVGPLKLVAVENTPEAHNLIVCTLCSCYPKMLLGLPPDWYKSIAYRSRAVREPRAVLASSACIWPRGEPCACTIARPTCATSSSRCALREPTASARSSCSRSSRATA